MKRAKKHIYFFFALCFSAVFVFIGCDSQQQNTFTNKQDTTWQDDLYKSSELAQFKVLTGKLKEEILSNLIIGKSDLNSMRMAYENNTNDDSVTGISSERIDYYKTELRRLSNQIVLKFPQLKNQELTCSKCGESDKFAKFEKAMQIEVNKARLSAKSIPEQFDPNQDIEEVEAVEAADTCDWKKLAVCEGICAAQFFFGDNVLELAACTYSCYCANCQGKNHDKICP